MPGMNTKLKVFLLAVPLAILFSSGVLFRSTVTVAAPDIACVSENLSGIPLADTRAIFNGVELDVPRVAETSGATQVLGVANASERWIEIDLSEQKLRAWDANNLFLETAISSGLPGTPTPVGEFRVWVKLRASKMEGGRGRNYYNLPNVPYIMYFENSTIPGWKGYGIHGAYWHNEFGTPRSHGCVNVPVPTAERLYYWATPELPQNKSSVFAAADNPGIKIVIHD
jgi:lipoprotein-anchoring transpeptidase ErfK/SrfK